MTIYLLENVVPQPTSPIQMVYFDLGNVLLHFDHQLSCQNLGHLFKVSPAEVQQVVFDSGLEDRYETGEISTQEFYELLCDRWGRKPPLQDVCHAAADIFTINHATVSLLVQLKAAGYRTGILSNTCEAHWRFVADGRYRFLVDFFDSLILSYEVKSMKPDRKIYQAAIDEAKLAAEEIFFMDDRPENVAGAIEAGLHAVHFTHGHDLASDFHQRGIRVNF